MMATSGTEVGTHLTPRCRQAIEEGLGFLANPGRGLYFGEGQHRGRRFRMVPGLGLSYEGERGNFEIPSATIEAMTGEIQAAFSSPEYAGYQRTLALLGPGDDDEFMMLMAVVLCLEEDPVMYRLLHHAAEAVSAGLPAAEPVTCA